MDILIFKKLDNGNYSAPYNGTELTRDYIISAIQDYNGLGNGKTMFFKEGGDVYLTDSPSIALGGAVP